MQIDKRNRAELKQYFVKNAMPTESNFAELIDAQLSQRDDGITRPPNDALCIEAAGDATSQKKALSLYSNFADPDPAWVLSLNPRATPADPATAKPGLSVSDATGVSRLFVERGSGRIGVGTLAPQAALHVAGVVRANRFVSENSLGLSDFTALNPQSNVYLASPPGDRDAWIYLDTADTNSNWGIYHRQIDGAVKGLPGNAIGFIGGGSKLQAYVGLADGSGYFAGSLQAKGMVSIGATTPVTDLTIRRDGGGQLGPVITLTNGSGGTNAGGAIDFNGYDVAGNAPTLRIRSLDDGNFSSHLSIATKVSGANNTALTERMRLTSGGNVGIGTAAPRGRLDVPTGDVYFGRTVTITAPADEWNGGVLNMINETSKKFWHINIRAGDADKLIFWRNDTNSFAPVLKLGMDGAVEAPYGVAGGELCIGGQRHGAVQYPYETIQLHPTHNLRVWFGTRERFVLANDGTFDIRFDGGYWRFQRDGNLVKYDNNNKAIWALNNVSGRPGWT